MPLWRVKRHGRSGHRGKKQYGNVWTADHSFCREIHRFNKGQQDYLLPFVEDGTLTLDEKVLDGASVQDLKTAFYKDNDLEEIAQKSIRVQANRFPENMPRLF